MARHPERSSHGQPQTPSAPKAPQFREVTRFSGVYPKEIHQRADVFTQAFPDADREELVATISLKEAERPRVDGALDALNQLSVLEVKGDEIGSRVRAFVVQQMTPPGRIIYDAVWTGEKPTSLTKPKEAPKPQAVAIAPQVRTAIPPRESFIDRKRAERDQRRQQKLEQAERDRNEQEKEGLREWIIDIGKYLVDHALETDEVRVVLGEDGKAAIMIRTLTWDPDGGRIYEVVDRITGIYEEGTHWRDKKSVRPDATRYLKAKAQALEGSEVEEYKPQEFDSEVLKEVYEKAVATGLLVVDSSSGATRFLVEAERNVFLRDRRLIDLERGVAVPSAVAKNEVPLNPSFVEVLKQKKAELDPKPTAKAEGSQNDAIREAYEKALADGSLRVTVGKDGQPVFEWIDAKVEGVTYYSPVDIEAGKTLSTLHHPFGIEILPEFQALLREETKRIAIENKERAHVRESLADGRLRLVTNDDGTVSFRMRYLGEYYTPIDLDAGIIVADMEISFNNTPLPPEKIKALKAEKAALESELAKKA